jgi:hypothetical protein
MVETEGWFDTASFGPMKLRRDNLSAIGDLYEETRIAHPCFFIVAQLIVTRVLIRLRWRFIRQCRERQDKSWPPIFASKSDCPN